VVNDVSFDLFSGKCMGLVGESGSGKSITALAMMQLLPQSASVTKQSRVFLPGQNDLLNFSEKKMRHVRGNKIAMIFQDAMMAFNPVYSIGCQISEVLKIHHFGNKSERQTRMQDLLKQVGIMDVGRTLISYPHQLSGGQRQRAMIAMALAAEPDILIADEPCTSLDVTIQAQVIALLKQLIAEKKIALLFISHDLGVVKQLSDDVIVMHKGVVVEASSAAAFYAAPQHEYSKTLIAAIPSLVPQKTVGELPSKLLATQGLMQYFKVRRGFFQRKRGFVKAVDGVDLACYPGQTLALVGESGSGKTTVAKTLVHLYKKSGGTIHFQGKKRRDIQMIFQDPYAALNPRMMVIQSLMEGLIARGTAGSEVARIKKAKRLLTMVGMDPDCYERYPHQFSGGQRQRICIARALALEPKLLILDEPTSSLDVSIQKQILGLLDDLQKRLGMSYLLITHDLGVVAYLAHHVAVMRAGKIVESGAAREVLVRPKEAYTKQLLAAVPQI
jgi:peptide/nickel transport system ATP-binding protein